MLCISKRNHIKAAINVINWYYVFHFNSPFFLNYYISVQLTLGFDFSYKEAR